MLNESDSPPGGYKVHWHVFLTHFPLAFLGVALLFQVLHLFAYPRCFELASTVALALGVTALVPTSLTGYFTWKRQYHSARVSIFERKVQLAISLLVIGIPLAFWRIVLIGASPTATRPRIHWLNFAATALMCVGAILEGYYGGRLSHRPRIQFQNRKSANKSL